VVRRGGEKESSSALDANGTADFALRRGGELIVHVVDAVYEGAGSRTNGIGIKSAATAASGAAIKSVASDDDGTARSLPPGDVLPTSRSSQK